MHTAALLRTLGKDNSSGERRLQTVARHESLGICLHAKRLLGKQQSAVVEYALLKGCILAWVTNVEAIADDCDSLAAVVKATDMRRRVAAERQAADYHRSLAGVFPAEFVSGLVPLIVGCTRTDYGHSAFLRQQVKIPLQMDKCRSVRADFQQSLRVAVAVPRQ